MSIFSSIGDAIGGVVGDVTGAIGGLASSAGSLLGGIPSSLIGSAITGGASLLGGLNQQASAQASVSQQEQFQEQERLSAYPDTVASLEAAGLNPVLAATNGPLGTPAGAMYNPQNILGGAANSAVQSYIAEKQAENVDKQGLLLDAQQNQAQSQADLNTYSAQKARIDANVAGQTADARTAAANASARADAAEDDLKSSLFKDPVGSGIMSAGEMIRNFFSPTAHSATQVAPQIPY